MKFIIALFMTANLFGNVSPDYITTSYYNPSIVISFDSWKSETLSVKIISENSKTIFNDILKTSNSEGIKYNLKNLESGKYIIKLENETKLVEETVILFDGKIVEKDAIVYFKPSININDDMINVSFLSYNGDVNVRIESDDVLFEDHIENTKPFTKVYNVKALTSRPYFITVSNDRVSKTITINK